MSIGCRKWAFGNISMGHGLELDLLLFCRPKRSHGDIAMGPCLRLRWNARFVCESAGRTRAEIRSWALDNGIL
jgi:hypothetical protein